MTPPHQTVMVILICITVLIIAAISDLARRIIPNALTASTLAGGLFYHLLCTGGVDGLMFSFSGIFLGGLLLFAPYWFGFTGAGDVKLTAALGAWIGPLAIGHVFICSTLAGGIMAAGSMLRHRRQTAGPPSPGTRYVKSGAVSSPTPGLPYALAIGTGYLCSLAWEIYR